MDRKALGLDLPTRLVNDYLHTRNSAWLELEKTYKPIFQMIGKSYNISPEELVGEVYLHLRGKNNDWSRLESYRAMPNVGFEHWLAVVVSRVALNMVKKQKAISAKEQPLMDNVDIEDKKNPFAISDLAIDLMKGIEKLKHKECRILLRRHYWDQIALTEIADEIQMKPDNIRQIHHRNLLELKKILGYDE